MNIAIIGLGYVGVVTGTCLSSLGHKVYGCDISKKKVDILLSGRMPFIEPGCEELLKKDLSNDLIDFTTDINLCLSKADIIIICVGTPSNDDDSVNLSYIKNVTSQIGEHLRKNDKWLGICIRSTVPVGTIRKTIIPILEKFNQVVDGRLTHGFHRLQSISCYMRGDHKVRQREEFLIVWWFLSKHI